MNERKYVDYNKHPILETWWRQRKDEYPTCLCASPIQFIAMCATHVYTVLPEIFAEENFRG